MKLKHVLKGHINDQYIFIESKIKKFGSSAHIKYERFAFTGDGMLEILEHYGSSWLEREVLNTTKKNNMVYIEIESLEEYCARLELIVKNFEQKKKQSTERINFTWEDERRINKKYGIVQNDVYSMLKQVMSILEDDERWNIYNSCDYNELKEYEKHLMLIYLNSKRYL